MYSATHLSCISPQNTRTGCSCPVWVWDVILWGGTLLFPCQGYRKLVLASDCVRKERKLVCLQIVLWNNVGLLVLTYEGSYWLTDVVRYIESYVFFFDLVEHGESSNTASLFKCWPTQSLSHLCHAAFLTYFMSSIVSVVFVSQWVTESDSD